MIHSVAVAIACFVTFWLAMHALARIHSVSHANDLLGGIWAVIATVFVYRTGYQQSSTAALSRMAATLLSFGLCLIYLLIFPFHPLGLAVLIGVGALVLTLIGRPEDVVTAGITTAVVLGVAALGPHDAWQQPILRLVDTAVGTAVGLAAAWTALRLKPAGTTGQSAAAGDRLSPRAARSR